MNDRTNDLNHDQNQNLNTDPNGMNMMSGTDAELEESYLRMLDSEVPDLWSRIEAGLDRMDAEPLPEYGTDTEGETADLASRDSESRRYMEFLAQQGQTSGRTPENVVAFTAKEKKKPRYGLLIGGIAAAAAVILLSVFVFSRMFGRDTKDSRNADPDAATMSSDQAKYGADVAGGTAQEDAAERAEAYENAGQTTEAEKEAGGRNASREQNKNAQQSHANKGSQSSVGWDSLDEPNGTKTEGVTDQTIAESVEEGQDDELNRQLPEKDGGKFDPEGSILPTDVETNMHVRTDAINLLGVTLEIKELSAEGCALIFTCIPNETAEEGTLITGEAFVLQEMQDGVWKNMYAAAIPVWLDYGITLSAETNTTLTVKWSEIYGTLQAGHYRIVKSLSTGKYINGYMSFLLAAEFTIE